MVKVLGSALVLGAGASGWLVPASAERRRADGHAAGAVRRALERMAEEIRLERTPLPRLLERLGRAGPRRGRRRSVLAAWPRPCGRGEPPETAWRAAAEALPPGRGGPGGPGGGRRGAPAGDEEQVCRALTAGGSAAAAEPGGGPESQAGARRSGRRRCGLSGGALLVILLI